MKTTWTRRAARAVGWVVVVALGVMRSGGAAHAGEMPPDYGFQWAVIDHPGNAPYVQDRGPDLPPLLYGGVNYSYRISKTEMRASDWLEFANAFVGLGDPFDIGHQVDSWTLQTAYGPGGIPAYFTLRNGQAPDRIQLMNVSWFNAARYCNWLHNNKEVSIKALQYGAYDLRAFTDGISEVLAGPQPRLPGAEFFLPTRDEWVKAVHFDPNRYGLEQGGYWTYPYSSDAPPVVGPIGVGQTNTGLDWTLPGVGELDFRVGAYPDAVTPWGLLDASGGVSEWLQDVSSLRYARWDGSSWIGRAPDGAPQSDRIDVGGALDVSGSSFLGFRIASAVPGPCAFGVGLCSVVFLGSIRRRVA